MGVDVMVDMLLRLLGKQEKSCHHLPESARAYIQNGSKETTLSFVAKTQPTHKNPTEKSPLVEVENVFAGGKVPNIAKDLGADLIRF
jgi:hypothetical protein